MGLLLAVLLVTWAFKRAVSDAIVDNNLAKQGKISPRLEARHGPGAGAKVAGYGMFDYFQDAWHDYWGRRGDALIAAKTAQPAPGQTRVTLSDRLNAGIAKLNDGVQRAADSPAVRTILDPVGPKAGLPPPVKPPPGPPPVVPIVDTHDVDEGTRRFVDAGEEEMFNGRWRPVPKRPDSPPAPANRKPSTGGTMTAPTGEAVNYQSTVAELDAMNRQISQMIDSVQAGKDAARRAADYLDSVETQRRPLATAAISTKEHLEGMSLDPTTMSGVDTACESLDPNAVSVLLATLESAEQQLQQILAALEAAQAGVSASRQNVIGTYGSSADVVEQTGIKATFLDSGNARVAGGPAGGGDGRGPSGSTYTSGADQGRPNVTVHDEPVNAPGQAFGSGKVTYNAGDEPPGAPAASSGQHSNRIVFNGPVDSRNSHTGSGNVTNN